MIKTIKNKEIAAFSADDLQSKLLDFKKSLFEIRFNSFVKDKKDTSLFKKNKKSIAKIKTRINQLKK
jgi:ribosomal protein L29